MVTHDDIQTFEDLERYLREFTNFLGDPVPYDFVGAFRLFVAVLDNVSRHHMASDLEELGPCLSEEQKQFLRKLDSF